jgi:hypothetical protein
MPKAKSAKLSANAILLTASVSLNDKSKSNNKSHFSTEQNA